MRLRHNSRLLRYRTPFGAVRRGSRVVLCLDVWDAPGAEVTLRTWVDGVGEQLAKMERYVPDARPNASDWSDSWGRMSDAGRNPGTDVGEAPDGGERYYCVLSLEHSGLVWYSFIVRSADGQTLWLGAPQGAMGGEGVTYDHPEPPSFQITVFRTRTVMPEWYRTGAVYQIFPDRYRRGPDWRRRADAALEEGRKGPRRVLVQDWYKPPKYAKDDQGSITAWDFYGGTLEGIREDLPRIASMGFSVIYLNPIFEAASNHRYDTADYLAIDPLLGDEEGFKRLCSDARELGISIVLDGVFNHTGCDSRYFNKYGNYPDVGAWQSEDSPYRSWYHINEDGSYDSWWGNGDLPAVNEDDPEYRAFILGENGVVRRWIRAGASGWRLDVADELPDDFIEGIRKSLLAEKPDALLLGEVWEDASNKVSYGRMRHYLFGTELDSVMNYLFRDAVLGLLTGTMTAGQSEELLSRVHENYPPQAVACLLNLLGSHDRSRVLTVLGGAPDPDSLSEEERWRYRLNEGQMDMAKSRYWLALLLQMTAAGVPCVYYGDEAGMQGMRDPYNRGCYPWGAEDGDCRTMVRNAMALRRVLPMFVDGDMDAVSFGDDVLGLWRMGSHGTSVLVLVNRSLQQAYEVKVPLRGKAAVELVSGEELERIDDARADVPGPYVDREPAKATVRVPLRQLGSAVVFFHAGERMSSFLEPGAGVVCHITSVPGRDGRAGTFGSPARRFIDFLEQAGFTYWQVLPVNPVDAFGSPYAGPSAFAGNESLLEETPEGLRRAFERFEAAGGPASEPAFGRFRERNASWLEPYAAFMAVKEVHEGAPWYEWPDELRTYNRALLFDPRFEKRALFREFAQWRFDEEWSALRAYAAERGIRIIGDIPMYVSADSVDVWSRPEQFSVDADGRIVEGAGAPPDQYAVDGQDWGMPTYRWKAMKEDGYSWWEARLRRAMELYDRTRLDHFLGFSEYFAIPEGGQARDGQWLPGPSTDLFRAMRTAIGPLPFIAEDLGIVTPAVRALLAVCGFPGMDVVQFQDYDVRQGFRSHAEKIAYTSTHDSSTLRGWCAKSFGGEEAAEAADKICRSVLESSAPVVMMQLQDVLGLGDEARMNLPGTTGGNWSWQCDRELMGHDVAMRWRSLLDETGRLPGEE